jgi:hypothetical protein
MSRKDCFDLKQGVKTRRALRGTEGLSRVSDYRVCLIGSKNGAEKVEACDHRQRNGDKSLKMAII